MTPPDPQAYGPVLAPLLTPARRNELGPGRPNSVVRETLDRLDVHSALGGRKVADTAMARCCLAGLWLYHDFLDRSHEISQAISSPEGSYWHGIMHRREPDPSNAKYWFRRVGRHAIYSPLAEFAAMRVSAEPPASPLARLASGAAWDPAAWIDLCEAARTGRLDAESVCREIAEKEWWLLFDYCYQRAVG